MFGDAITLKPQNEALMLSGLGGYVTAGVHWAENNWVGAGQRIGDNCNHHTIGGVGRVEDLDDLHFQTTSCLCPSHTSRTLEKKVLG